MNQQRERYMAGTKRPRRMLCVCFGQRIRDPTASALWLLHYRILASYTLPE